MLSDGIYGGALVGGFYFFCIFSWGMETMDSPADVIAVAIISHRKNFSFLRFFGPLRSAKITFREGEKKSTEVGIS